MPNETPTTSRRSAFRRFGLTAIAAGLAAPALASTPALPPHPTPASTEADDDAALIALCAECDRLERKRRIVYTFWDENSDADEAALEALENRRTQ